MSNVWALVILGVILAISAFERSDDSMIVQSVVVLCTSIILARLEQRQ